MTGIELYSTTAANNNSAVPNGWPEGMAPSGVNDAARQMMAAIRTWYEDAMWIDFGYTPTYIGATQFSVTGDKTTTFQVGRRIKAYGTTPFTIFGTISAVAYASVTTVTVVWDSGSLDSTLTKTYVGSAAPTNGAICAAAVSNTTASLIASFDANIVLSGLSTSIYPSLTELSYVKGVTSAIQTQIGTKVTSGGALGTPASGTLTNCTGLPISSGVSGLGTGVATFLATPSSANIASAVTDEVGTGSLAFQSSGTWTVNVYDAVTAGNVSATSVAGNYTRTGNEVTCWFTGLNNIDTTGMTGANVLFFSLPFTPATRATGSIVLDGFTYPASRVQANSMVINAQARGRIFGSASSQSVAHFTVASATTGASDIAELCITYQV